MYVPNAGRFCQKSRPAPDDLSRVLRALPDDRNAVSVARLFVNYALARGGQDNVSVAIHAFTP